MSSHHALKTAKRQHQAGNLAEAEKIYRQILAEEPDDPDVLRLLGTVESQRGNYDAAFGLIGRAIQINPHDFQSHRAFADMLAKQGRIDQAIVNYRKALEIHWNDAKVHRDLGEILLAAGRLDEAAASFGDAIQADPNDAPAHAALARVRSKQDRFDEAIAAASRSVTINGKLAEAHAALGDALRGGAKPAEALSAYRQALQLKPNDFGITHNLGHALRDLDRMDEAAEAYSKAAELQPGNPMPQFDLGRAYYAAGRLRPALAAFEKAAAVMPDLLEIHVDMAIILAHLARFDEALACHARAAALNPSAGVTHLAMGEILLHQQKPIEATDYLRRAAAADPTLWLAWSGLGTALRAQGKFDEAAECFSKMLETDPKSRAGYHTLLSTGKVKFNSDDVARLTASLNQPNLAVPDRISLGFALGRALDELGRFDEAFTRYAEANAIVKRSRALAGERYYPRAVHRTVDEMIEGLTPSFFQARRDWGDPSEIPVFVVGMPRSGTTLVHQIAASHPQVHGAGELREIAILARPLGASDVKKMLELAPEAVRSTAESHLQHLRGMNPIASRIVDKMPNNIFALGFISLLFPRARIIICRRDPRDTCLSCYFQYFRGGNSFTFDLAHCGHWYREITRLAEHWLRALPLQMMEMQYEAMVADVEGQSRRLIEFLGLPWDPACLEFYRAQTTVLTASVWQVRQPIYSTSVGRWRHYEKHLRPLLEALEGKDIQP